MAWPGVLRCPLSGLRGLKGCQLVFYAPSACHPFPLKQSGRSHEQVDNILVVEMNSGMMLEDVLKEAKGSANVEFYGRMGGIMPFPDEILSEIKRILAGTTHTDTHPREQWLKRMEGIA